MRSSLLSLLAVLVLVGAAPADPEPRLARERIVLSTEAGDIVLALYPDVAPRHVEQLLRLVRLGVYDTTHFYRVEPTFLVQLSTAYDRSEELTAEQRATIHRLPAELNGPKHRRGVLSMAREDNDPNSAETSFSILLADAPHLDGKYTVFGHVESGMSVVEQICKVPRNVTHNPLVRVEVSKATVAGADQLASRSLAPARPIVVPAELLPREPSLSWEIAVGLGLMVLVGVVCFAFAHRLPPRVVLSLNLLSVLVGGFLLFVVLMPQAHAHSWLALALFLGLLGVLRLMSQFESAA
jgi:cyclophilin family peptidyl-prolyl cis-trans isomerase